MSTITMSTPVRTAPRAARRPVARRSAVRLTRRGRVVLVALALAVALAVGVLWASQSVATDRPGDGVATETLRVAPGDTLWAIASERSAPGDVQSTIDQIRSLNAMSSGALQAGQLLRVPAA